MSDYTNALEYLCTVCFPNPEFRATSRPAQYRASSGDYLAVRLAKIRQVFFPACPRGQEDKGMMSVALGAPIDVLIPLLSRGGEGLETQKMQLVRLLWKKMGCYYNQSGIGVGDPLLALHYGFSPVENAQGKFVIPKIEWQNFVLRIKIRRDAEIGPHSFGDTLVSDAKAAFEQARAGITRTRKIGYRSAILEDEGLLMAFLAALGVVEDGRPLEPEEKRFLSASFGSWLNTVYSRWLVVQKLKNGIPLVSDELYTFGMILKQTRIWGTPTEVWRGNEFHDEAVARAKGPAKKKKKPLRRKKVAGEEEKKEPVDEKEPVAPTPPVNYSLEAARASMSVHQQYAGLDFPPPGGVEVRQQGAGPGQQGANHRQHDDDDQQLQEAQAALDLKLEQQRKEASRQLRAANRKLQLDQEKAQRRHRIEDLIRQQRQLRQHDANSSSHLSWQQQQQQDASPLDSNWLTTFQPVTEPWGNVMQQEEDEKKHQQLQSAPRLQQKPQRQYDVSDAEAQRQHQRDADDDAVQESHRQEHLQRQQQRKKLDTSVSTSSLKPRQKEQAREDKKRLAEKQKQLRQNAPPARPPAIPEQPSEDQQQPLATKVTQQPQPQQQQGADEKEPPHASETQQPQPQQQQDVDPPSPLLDEQQQRQQQQQGHEWKQHQQSLGTAQRTQYANQDDGSGDSPAVSSDFLTDEGDDDEEEEVEDDHPEDLSTEQKLVRVEAVWAGDNYPALNSEAYRAAWKIAMEDAGDVTVDEMIDYLDIL